MKKSAYVRVCVTRCNHCGDELYGFRPHAGECPRCGRTFRLARWIARPHPETVARARREGSGEGKP